MKVTGGKDLSLSRKCTHTYQIAAERQRKWGLSKDRQSTQLLRNRRKACEGKDLLVMVSPCELNMVPASISVIMGLQQGTFRSLQRAKSFCVCIRASACKQNSLSVRWGFARACSSKINKEVL